MKKLALITLTTLAILGTQSPKATDLSKDEQIESLQARIHQLEQNQFITPADLSDDTIDYYSAYQILKAYNGLEYDERVQWEVKEHSIEINLSEGL